MSNNDRPMLLSGSLVGHYSAQSEHIAPCREQCDTETAKQLVRASKGPLAWHAGQDAGLTTSLMFWKNGPNVKPQRRQSYLTCCSCGKTPDRRVTTPVSRTSWFRWNCLLGTNGKNASVSAAMQCEESSLSEGVHGRRAASRCAQCVQCISVLYVGVISGKF